ncbi:hypothetical protein [Bacillus cereus group sp. BfR-BA-01538]|uniref:hypothetical protein n=1 Tax=Bacillus cereus group sp. BfR-BA-01538 TaxID=2920373 RepID=UPI001F57D751
MNNKIHWLLGFSTNPCAYMFTVIFVIDLNLAANIPALTFYNPFLLTDQESR